MGVSQRQHVPTSCSRGFSSLRSPAALQVLDDSLSAFGDGHAGVLARVLVEAPPLVEEVYHGELEAGYVDDVRLVAVGTDHHGACAEGGVDVVLSDDRYLLSVDRCRRVLADELVVALVGGVHAYGDTGGYVLGACGRDDEFTTGDAEGEAVDLPSSLEALDLCVGDGRLASGAVVNWVLPLVDESLPVEYEEAELHLPDVVRVHGAVFEAPVGTCAEAHDCGLHLGDVLGDPLLAHLPEDIWWDVATTYLFVLLHGDLRGHPVAVPALWEVDVEAPHPLVAGSHVEVGPV